jgi:predicted ATPase/class 3 adenylate cyclase
MAQLPSGTVTLLFTDIEGSTRLLERLGDRYLEVLGEHRRLLRAAFAKFAGHEVGTEGDAFFVAFAKASDAVAAAVAGQRALAKHSWPDGVVLQVRMGIHTGEPITDAGDYAGLDVHRAARICAAGHGGQVLCSQATRELLGAALPARVGLRDLGEHRLKDLSGSQRLFQLVIPGLPGEFPALRTLGPRPTNLPVQLARFVGRERELARLHELLDDPACRLVTLVGPGGIGKTRLAVQVAETRQDRYRDGVVFVSLVGVVPTRPEEAGDLLVANLAGALGVSLAVPRDRLELLADHLAARQLLLVLDNLEQLQHATQVVVKLLGRAPGLQVLATSRRRLGLGGEWLVEVAGLPYPPSEAGDPGEYAAVQLFEDRARLLRPGLRSAEERQEVARICRLVAGVPLAIELAARWIRSATPAVIAEQLASGLELLATSAPEVERRHQSLRAVIDWSWQLLSDDERRVLARLSVLRGGFDLDAATVVADATLPLLGGLVDHSLVEVTEDGRYAIHELLRQYAEQRLRALGEECAARSAHAYHYSRFLHARRDKLVDLTNVEGPAEVDPEFDNLRAAWQYLAEEAEIRTVARFVDDAWLAYQRRSRFQEALTLLDRAVTRTDATMLQRARWHRWAGQANYQLGKTDGAHQQLVAALALVGCPQPVTTPGWLLLLVRQAARQAAHRIWPRLAKAHKPAARQAAAEAVQAYYLLGEIYFLAEERLPLLAATVHLLNCAERAGSQAELALGYTAAAFIARVARRSRLARWYGWLADNAIAAAREEIAIARPLEIRAFDHIAAGAWEAAEATATRARKAFTRAGQPRFAEACGSLLATINCYRGRYPHAARGFAEEAALARARHDPYFLHTGLVGQAEALLRSQADAASALVLLGEASALLPQLSPADRMRQHATLALAYLQDGRQRDAAAAAQTAYAEARTVKLPPVWIGESYTNLAEVLLALWDRDGDRATDRWGAVAGGAAAMLWSFANTYPAATARAWRVRGSHLWLRGRRERALRAWQHSLQAAQHLELPYEEGLAHLELGRHLAPGRSLPVGWDRVDHLRRARELFEPLDAPVALAAIDAAHQGT